MKHILASLVLLLASLGSANAIGVLEAMQAGDISLSGSSSSGYSESKIVVTNKRSYSVDIDFSTACFVQANQSQRIGLSYEKTTFNYYLRLSGGRTYTLYFSSRCLDSSRSSPSGGVAFTKVYSISSQFSAIITALRYQYSQSDVWNVTNSSSIADAWKRADARYTAPPVTTARIDLSGSISWQVLSSTSVNFKAGRIDNLGGSTSGSLRLRVWATRSSYAGGSISGYIVGTLNLNALSGGYYYSNINSNVSYSRPAAGTYYTTMTIEEYTSSGWLIRDYINCSGTVRF